MSRVLVLSRGKWKAVNVVTPVRAFNLVSRKRAVFLDPKTAQTYNLESWVETWEDAKKSISSGSIRIRTPEIIVLTHYDGPGYDVNGGPRKVKGSRRNYFAFYKNTCAYCGKVFPKEELNLDHVIPRSRGGLTNWENIVLSCVKCNDKKSNMTPKEAGMKITRNGKPWTPRAPLPGELKCDESYKIRCKLGKDIPESWMAYLDKRMSDLYWDVGLEP